jgi:hypothetical protein
MKTVRAFNRLSNLCRIDERLPGQTVNAEIDSMVLRGGSSVECA